MDVDTLNIVRAAISLAHQTGALPADAIDSMLERPHLLPSDLERLAASMEGAARALRRESARQRPRRVGP